MKEIIASIVIITVLGFVCAGLLTFIGARLGQQLQTDEQSGYTNFMSF